MPENTCPAGKGETEWPDKQQILVDGLRSFNRVHKSDGSPCGEGCKAQEKPKDAHSSVCACPSCVADSLEQKPEPVGEEIPQETVENFLWAIGRSRTEGSGFWTSMWHSNAYWRKLADKFRSLQAEITRLQGIHDKVWAALEANVSGMVESQVQSIMEAAQVDGLDVSQAKEITRLRGLICKGCANGWKRVPNGHIEPTPDKNYERSIPCKALNPKEDS